MDEIESVETHPLVSCVKGSGPQTQTKALESLGGASGRKERRTSPLIRPRRPLHDSSASDRMCSTWILQRESRYCYRASGIFLPTTPLAYSEAGLTFYPVGSACRADLSRGYPFPCGWKIEDLRDHWKQEKTELLQPLSIRRNHIRYLYTWRAGFSTSRVSHFVGEE